MSDDKNRQGQQDDIRVNSNDPSEVEYLHRKFPGKTHEEIKKRFMKKDQSEKK